MLPLRLEIKNFLAYRAPSPIVFDGIHLACLTGANGAGKSSLLDAITWALWGKSRAKRDEDLVHLGQNDMHVQLDFEAEGTRYRVLRKRTRKSGGSGQLELFAWHDEQWRTQSEPSIRATQHKINSMLRLDYETFVHSAFLQQGKADAFTTKPPAQRKQILSDILGLDRWQVYEEAVKERMKLIENRLIVLDADLRRIDDELATEPRLREAAADAERVTTEAQAALDAADARLREVEHAPNSLAAAQNELVRLEREILERTREHQTVTREIENYHKRIGEYEDILAARAQIEEGYQIMQAARADDHTLSDKLMQLSAFDQQHNELMRQLDGERAQLEKRAAQLETAIEGYDRAIANANPDKLDEVQQELLALATLEAERDAFQTEAQTLESTRAELMGSNKSLRDEMNTLKDRINRLSTIEGAICPMCGQPLDEDHRDTLIAEITATGKEKGDEYRQNIAEIEAMEAQVADLRQNATDLDLQVKRLTQMRGQAEALQAGLQAAEEAKTQRDAIQQELDAVRQTLNDEAYGAEIRVEIAALNAQREALDYNSEAHHAIREQLNTYHAYETRYNELQRALESLGDQRDLLSAAEARQAQIQTRLQEYEEAVQEVNTRIEALTALVSEYEERNRASRDLRIQWSEANNKLIIAKQGLKALEDQKIRRADIEAQRDSKRADKLMHDELRVAFGKNGIPAMMIETAIPELEASSNAILSRMTDGRMSLKIDTQREKVSGGTAETLEIHISDERGTRSYEMYSGGESFRINFAIRVALSQLLARRAGAHLRTLFIDEGFGTQDEDGRNKLIEAINAVQHDFDLIFAITHIEELRDAFPVHILIEKHSEGSRVSMR